MMTLELLKQLAKALAVQFGNDCEVVIHDLTRKSLHKSIVYIENGHITNRKTGDGPSKVVLETMRKDPSKISDHLGYLTKTNDGKTLKSSTIFVREEEGGPIQYIFRILSAHSSVRAANRRFLPIIRNRKASAPTWQTC